MGCAGLLAPRGRPSCVGHHEFVRNDTFQDSGQDHYMSTQVIRLSDWKWLRELRKTEVTDRVANDPRSQPDTLLGVPFNDAQEFIEGGQADFDAPIGPLSPDDRVLLYAYSNQLGHLEELIAAFSQHFENSAPPNPIVVDIGCGPFTGGLALAATLEKNTRFDYIGIDRAKSMQRFGERLASSDLMPASVARQWTSDIDHVKWAGRGWREVIVIVSYLFASPALDVQKMFSSLNKLLDRLGQGAVTLLYTNSAREQANLRYPAFRSKLKGLGFQVRAEGEGEILIERSGALKPRTFWYALFRRPRRGTLILKG